MQLRSCSSGDSGASPVRPTPHGSFVRRSMHGLAALIVGALPSAAACSSEDSGSSESSNNSGVPFCGAADTCPPDTSGVDLTTPVSFRNDIYQPIFQRTCNAITCHGAENTPAGGLWLGQRTGEPSEELLESIVSHLLEPSATAPAMKNVEPGKPEESFLMLKVDGCQDRAGLSCTVQERALCNTPCGDAMPQLVEPPDEAFPLPIEQRHAIRAWIAQGAQNN